MIALYDHIQELRAELRGCCMTRRERAATQAELARAIAAQAEIDRAFEARFETDIACRTKRAAQPETRFRLYWRGLFGNYLDDRRG
jgi:hypothetical protein